MRKALILLIIIISILSGCKKNEAPTASAPMPDNPADYKGTIGIAKIIAHPALDAVEQGVIDELKVQGYVNAVIDVQNANGEIATAASIATKFKSQKADVVLGIATPMALALANQMRDNPVVFSAVTDPIDAGLRTTNDTDKTNITGVSDITPVKEQDILSTRLNDVKKLGFIKIVV